MFARSAAVTPPGRGVHQGAEPWYDPRAARILRRPVAARAIVRASVVASVPFLANMAQSACATVAVSASASSTIRGDGAFWQSASRRCASAAASTLGCWCPSTTGP